MVGIIDKLWEIAVASFNCLRIKGLFYRHTQFESLPGHHLPDFPQFHQVNVK